MDPVISVSVPLTRPSLARRSSFSLTKMMLFLGPLGAIVSMGTPGIP
jgi:hypothetical protein